MTRTENIDPLILISHVIFTLLASQAFKKWPNTIFGRINARYILAQELKLNSLIITQSCTLVKILYIHTQVAMPRSLHFERIGDALLVFFSFHVFGNISHERLLCNIKVCTVYILYVFTTQVLAMHY